MQDAPVSYPIEYHSLWLDVQRASWPQLEGDLDCDTAIVGGGISGVSTLYFLLTETDQKVVLFERNRIATGATGHNAGIPSPHIERPVSELIEEFGFERTKETFDEIDHAQQLLVDMHEKVGFQENLCPLTSRRFGLSTIEEFFEWIQQKQIQVQLGRDTWELWLLDDPELKKTVPSEFGASVEWVSKERLSCALKTDDAACIGLGFSLNSGIRMNSAAFCDRVLRYLADEFSDRCSIYEQTEITCIQLESDGPLLTHPFGSITAKDLILCTNAYTDFSIVDSQTNQPILKWHQEVLPREGYLAGYPSRDSECLLWGMINDDPHTPYWYLSTAPLSREGKERLTCLGGPEYDLPSSPDPDFIDRSAKESLGLMGKFLRQSDFSPSYFWHGTMAYTKSGLRWVGQDPDHPHLWYNLGCNGTGILSAIGGADRIAKLMNGKTCKPSLFDPPEKQHEN